ncbi:2OG-Fe(II) oxygenase [Novosphingobium mangrovi (ex Huang et al. 2023)]|uniref:2OG-Fe(II) oxygenase n=1 Tax=Novosphingobium mangrovi (ex Huang et al. 2023) TaxID=2976432 RepID=A0ABT2I562_9SPHN|nr:2OG-Fe(II) oxygenase [Novosphingobium mangrovi (ex Huang et al. 2023)]MCT2399687.1 2OG-Fe(II) oxygenase [Novosphingobium mangrovi (ex Huang et al. 2023)]
MTQSVLAERAESDTTGKPVLDFKRDDGFFELDRKAAREIGASYAERYRTASPFPHIVLDNFMDREILREVNREFPQSEKGRFSDEFSQLKTGYTLDKIRSAYIQDLFSALNSAAFLNFLEKMTGIQGLVSDPRFVGGGLHETRRGGHLSIHADFNIHPTSRMRRRLNLILFLNEDWNEEWGGALELWNKAMTACEHKVLPEIGRAVVFNTDSTSYHGHPDPLETPPDITRRSIALYYYTVPEGLRIPHTTVWKKRPGTNDKAASLGERTSYVIRHLLGKRSEY